jgi:hypothetical protein
MSDGHEPVPAQALPLSRLEAASGLALGFDDVPTFTIGPSDLSPLDAMIAAAADVLARGPTYVSFSGGRDSSGVLAAATLAARRHGLPEPIPISMRFAGLPRTDESRWQEIVIDHLKLERWEVLEIGAELDLLGEMARETVLRHGVLWPPNAFFHIPMLKLARGGSLMTGFDGDGVLGHWRWERAQSVLHRRVRLSWRDPLRVGLALSPPLVRRPFMPKPLVARVAPWLRASAAQALERSAREESAAEPRHWGRHLAAHGRRRFLRLGTHSLGVLGAAHDVTVEYPILDHRFVSALAQAGGASGLGDRTAVMRTVFGDELPDELLSRSRKAEFGAAFWRGEAHAFVDEWDGTGLDSEFVDAERLRDAWRAESPFFGSTTLLHAAWLASHGG